MGSWFLFSKPLGNEEGLAEKKQCTGEPQARGKGGYKTCFGGVVWFVLLVCVLVFWVSLDLFWFFTPLEFLQMGWGEY